LADLLDHAYQAQAKVVLVGDDRQLAAIDAGGGFRALRLRLGASELTENRRQQQAWEREALELVRSGLVEEAVAAYQAHDRVVAAESKPAATLALLQDWWAAYQDRERDPTQDVIVLAGRRAEADRLNTACQQLLAARGRLDQEQLQVEDLKLAVGDRVVCGRNAISQLGIANGTRGTVTALDPEARTLTIRVDAKDPKEVTLPAWYLDGRGRRERNRRIDLAYATTGHRAQGLTRWRALVRLTGSEDANWLYVQLSRARQDTRLYAVVGPEPQGPAELDLPDREVGDGYAQLAQALSRAGDQRLAIDTPSTLDLRRLSTRELRAERDRLRALLDQAPGTGPGSWRGPQRIGPRPSRSWSSSPAGTDRRVRAAECLGCFGTVTGPLPTPGWWRWARQQADRAHDSERELRQHQQRRAGGHGGRPRPRSRTTAAPTTSPTPRPRLGRCLASRPGGPPGSRPARRSNGCGAASAPPIAPASSSGPRRPPQDRSTAASTTCHQPGRNAPGPARSGPPANSAKEANHATASFRPARPRPRMAIVRRRAARRVDPAA
jgi:hypothetical protein